MNAPAIDIAREFLQSDSTLATPGIVICIKLTQPECVHWDPAVLEQAVEKEIGGPPNMETMQRIHALMSVLASDGFFHIPEIFHAVTDTVLSPDARPDLMLQPPAPLEMAWTCFEVSLLLGEAYSPDNFTANVKRYCGAALLAEDLYTPPPELSFADYPPGSLPSTDYMREEEMAAFFWDDQNDRLKAIEGSMKYLKGVYTQQLKALVPLGLAPKVQDLFARHDKRLARRNDTG